MGRTHGYGHSQALLRHGGARMASTTIVSEDTVAVGLSLFVLSGSSSDNVESDFFRRSRSTRAASLNTCLRVHRVRCDISLKLYLDRHGNG